MRSKHPIPRSPRNRPPSEPVVGRAGYPWIGRVALVLLGALLTAIGGVLSQGPDAIRKLPELPDAVSETVTRTLEEKQIDWRLSGTWEYAPIPTDSMDAPAPLRISIEVAKGLVYGELFSARVRKWTIYDMAMIEGTRDSESLRLHVFEIIQGKKTRLADISVRFREEPQVISDHAPALVMDELEARVLWQQKQALPREFLLRRIGK